MATALKLFSVVLFLTILSIGNGDQCDLSSIEITSYNTGKTVGSDFIFEVEVKNQCHCMVRNIFLDSYGFTTTAAVDPKQLRLEGGHYLINDGKGIPSLGSFKFHYASNHWWRMVPAGFQLAC